VWASGSSAAAAAIPGGRSNPRRSRFLREDVCSCSPHSAVLSFARLFKREGWQWHRHRQKRTRDDEGGSQPGMDGPTPFSASDEFPERVAAPACLPAR